MEFVEIEWQSELYRQEIELRDRMLRAPLGLVFSEEDVQAEAKELHFGIIDGNIDGNIDQQRLIACAVIVPLSDRDVKLRQMVVTAAQQRTGIGTRLIGQIEATLAERGIQQIELNARDIAIGFYERLGYAKQGEAFIEVSIPHWKMTESIDPPYNYNSRAPPS
jgi:predicted GNAT family N-acyltransferase